MPEVGRRHRHVSILSFQGLAPISKIETPKIETQTTLSLQELLTLDTLKSSRLALQYKTGPYLFQQNNSYPRVNCVDNSPLKNQKKTKET